MNLLNGSDIYVSIGAAIITNIIQKINSIRLCINICLFSWYDFVSFCFIPFFSLCLRPFNSLNMNLNSISPDADDKMAAVNSNIPWGIIWAMYLYIPYGCVNPYIAACNPNVIELEISVTIEIIPKNMPPK